MRLKIIVHAFVCVLLCLQRTLSTKAQRVVIMHVKGLFLLVKFNYIRLLK